MKIALAFGRPDVDGLLDELTAEQFEEWAAFFAINPQGWDAQRMIGSRICYVTAQVQSRKRLDERPFEIRSRAAAAARTERSAAYQRGMLEAMAIRSEIEESLKRAN